MHKLRLLATVALFAIAAAGCAGPTVDVVLGSGEPMDAGVGVGTPPQPTVAADAPNERVNPVDDVVEAEPDAPEDVIVVTATISPDAVEATSETVVESASDDLVNDVATEQAIFTSADVDLSNGDVVLWFWAPW